MRQIGVDEAGRGALLGPLVVASLSIPAADEYLLVDAGVDDSKHLTPNRRDELDRFIRAQSEHRDWHLAVEICSAAIIDITMQTETLNTLECHLFAAAISALPDVDDPCTLHLDACDVDVNRFKDRVMRLLPNACEEWEVLSEHGADARYACVAGASILAKVARDLAVKELNARSDIPLGSGYPSDPVTKGALQQLITADEPPAALRRAWAPVAAAWRERHDSPIPPRELPEGEARIGGQASLF